MTGLVQKTGGTAFSIECQSKAFRLPPLKINGKTFLITSYINFKLFICFGGFFFQYYIMYIIHFKKILIAEKKQKRLEEKRERTKARRDKTTEVKKSQENSKNASLHKQFQRD